MKSIDIRSSNLFKQFVNEIQFENRNPKQTRVLDLLNDKNTNTIIILKSGEELYRSRLIRNKKEIGELASEGFFGYNASGSFVPPKENTKEMRANYRYIPYLYVASSPLASIYEIRPRFGAEVSVATIKVKKDLEILDFTMSSIVKSMTDPKKNLFAAISECFSKPITHEDDVLDYIPTQYIAEYTKNLGYDGIAFKSSVFSDEDCKRSSSINFVIFNYNKVKPVGSNVISIKRVSYDAEQIDTGTRLILEAKK